MPSGVVRIEGKEIALDQQIIDAGIPAIKAALSVDFPAVENADIEIVSAGGGAPKVATVVKRGTGKGGVNLNSSRKLPTIKSGDIKEHLERGTREAVGSLLRRMEATKSQQVVLQLCTTSCACGAGSEEHPDSHWIILVGGPFLSREQAMNALADVTKTKGDVLKHAEYLRRPLTGKDITGGS